MANRFLGEKTVEVDGRRYTLRCDFNAMCAFEDETGQDALEMFHKFETGEVSVKSMRAMVWAFMQHHQPGTTLADAGDLLSKNVEVLMDVIKAASPTEEEAAGLGNDRQKSKVKAV